MLVLSDFVTSVSRHCGIRDPSWSELHHFVWFLNTQLHDYEGNNFVSIAAAEDLPGFAKFVLRFLIQMSRVRGYDLSQLMRLWYLSHRRPEKAQASLRIHTVSPEPSLFAHIRMEVDEGSEQKSNI